MHGTSKCFYQSSKDVLEACPFGVKVSVISSKSLKLPAAPAFGSTVCTLKDAITKEFAFYCGEDSILVMNGKLWISACEQTYNKAGLEMKKINDRYHASFKISDLNKRVKWCLETTLTDKLAFTVVSGTSEWKAGDEMMISIPPLQVPDDELEDWAPAFYEWVGLVILESEVLQKDQDPAFCQYFPLDYTPKQPIYLHTLEGFITPDYVKSILALQDTFMAITVHGLEYSPMAWNKPHHWGKGGEHGYTIVSSASRDFSYKLVSRQDL